MKKIRAKKKKLNPRILIINQKKSALNAANQSLNAPVSIMTKIKRKSMFLKK